MRASQRARSSEQIFEKTAAHADAEEFGCNPSNASSFDVSKSPSNILKQLSAVAKECKIWLFAGSYPERDGSHVYNTMPVFDPTGKLVATYRKTHLCDLPFMDGVRESDFITPGQDFINVETGQSSSFALVKLTYRQITAL